jgi:hypothetical protein
MLEVMAGAKGPIVKTIVLPPADGETAYHSGDPRQENRPMAQKITGGCLCGAVRYTISGDIIFSGKCYCEDCRKGGSTGHSSVLAVPQQAVSITGKLTEFKKPGGSGQSIARRFCPVCGSRIAAMADVMPGVVMITASTLDDPEQYVTQMSVFTSRAPSWDRPPAGLPAFAEMPPAQG